jgi:hypothetical protein
MSPPQDSIEAEAGFASHQNVATNYQPPGLWRYLISIGKRRLQMIVGRDTLIVKRGCSGKIIELIKAEIAKSSEGHKFRLYVPVIGKDDSIAVEGEYESLAEYEKFWNIFNAKPETAEYYKNLLELTETGGWTEIWYLVET